MRFALIGNPENRRVTRFQSALEDCGCPPAEVIAYRELLPRGTACLRGCDVDMVRIESPGENAWVERALVERGAETLPQRASGDGAFPNEHGRIFRPDLWFAGYRDLLVELDRIGADQGLRFMNAPRDIAVMFDKTECQRRLAHAGLPVPRYLGEVASYDGLRAKMRAQSLSRVFVKLRTSSSASGVVALRYGSGRVSAATTVEMAESDSGVKLYNSLQVRDYTNERDVAQLINTLCSSDVHVEEWLPKAGWHGKTFDLRVMVIAGSVRHRVMRCSQGPITNLHLGNARGNIAEFLTNVEPRKLEAAWEDCRRVADLFPQSRYFGIDLMFTPGLRKHYILEINAFGDLLPGVRDQEEDTYTAEIRSCRRERSFGEALAR